jgi:hypothetical protein
VRTNVPKLATGYFAILVIIGILLCSSFVALKVNAKDEIRPIFIFELRAPKALNVETNTGLGLASYSGEEGTRLWACKQTTNETFQIFFYHDGFVLSEEPVKGRVFIIDPWPASNQVFRLPIPSSPKPQDWSQWQRPDFLATGDVGWSFIYDKKINNLSTNIPPDCFELRYKIENRNLGSK